MALTIDQNNILSVTRGDTFEVPLFINQGNDLKPMRYTVNDKDEIYLAVMQPDQYFENAILKKKYTKADINSYGDIVIRIEHDDTKCLIPGKYYYQVKGKIYNLDTDKIDVNTIIQRTEFFITE
mgnify:CR=1 FL=1